MNGRMSKEARALEVARFAICDFQEQVGAVIDANKAPEHRRIGRARAHAA